MFPQFFGRLSSSSTSKNRLYRATYIKSLFIHSHIPFVTWAINGFPFPYFHFKFSVRPEPINRMDKRSKLFMIRMWSVSRSFGPAQSGFLVTLKLTSTNRALPFHSILHHTKSPTIPCLFKPPIFCTKPNCPNSYLINFLLQRELG